MDRTKQKGKKEKPNKYVDKDKSPTFIADVKTLKENLKIREILRTVKMNSSMRIKAPRGSKVMQNKDFQEGEDLFEDKANEGDDPLELPSATNLHIVSSVAQGDTSENDSGTNEETQVDTTDSVQEEDVEDEVENNMLHKSKSLSEGLEHTGREDVSTPSSQGVPTVLSRESPLLRARDRKLSLDHTMLSKREGFSQSEVDLHSIGKSPLERKSSFFRKKMDSFLKNTREIFKKQSSMSSVQRKGSTCSRMSVSMQSLNENEVYSGDYDSESQDKYNDSVHGSTTSLRPTTPARSNSSASVARSELPPGHSDTSLASKHALDGSQPLDHMSSSVHSLSERYVQESFLHSRAISMSSGLDTAHGPRQRKTSRSNRVTWLASESLTDYFRRLIQDETSKEMQSCNSYQDFSTISENTLYGSPKTDSRGRRLSYQRAVSGEDPVYQRYQESLRRRKITETVEGNNELSACLAEFSRCGVPPLMGFQIRSIPDDAFAYLLWAESELNLEEHYDWKKLTPVDEARQAVIKELIHTEADHIRHLMNIVEVYIAAAHALQDVDKLLDLETSRLFLNIPDVLNANMRFWELVMYPMIEDSFRNQTYFNTDLMAPGFAQFAEIFEPYEDYVCEQSKAVDYLRALTSNTEFMTYLTWCHNKNPSNRLQLADILVKPMQRLTKYSLILRRIITYTESEESKMVLDRMENATVTFLHRVNRAIRQREELSKLEEMEKAVDSYDVDFRDEELDRYFHMLNEINLRTPMVNCGPENSRAIIHQGDLRFKDNMKETEVRAILFTDMLLICKKLTKGSPYSYKMIRPKYLLERTIPFARFSSRTNPLEVAGLIYVVLDEHGTAYTAFCLSEPAKDPNPQQTLRIWDQKIREARLSYELSVWFYRNPVRDLSEVEADYSSEGFKKEYPDEWAIERRSRELVAAMLHPNRRPSTCQEITTIRSDSFEPGRGPPSLRHLLHRTSTGGSSRLSSFHQQSTSSRNSRLSSFHQSASAASHDEPPYALKYLYKAGSSVEHLIPPQNPDDVARSITVNVVSESECETVVPSRQPTPPVLVLQQSSPHHSPGPRSASAGGSQNTLRVSPQHSVTMVHSLPDLSIEQTVIKPSLPPVQQSASEKLYQSHQELLQRNRLAASQHQYLSPDHRGISYPPPSPTRASLKRGLAFSYSFKNPPLSKMGHVNSQSQVNIIDHSQASTSKIKVPVVPQISQDPSTSSDKTDKKKQLTRSKAGAKASSPEPVKVDPSLHIDDPTHKQETKDKTDGRKTKDALESRLSFKGKSDDSKSTKDSKRYFKEKSDSEKYNKIYFKSKSDDDFDSRLGSKTNDDDGRWSFKAKSDDGKDSRKSFKTSDDDKDSRWSFKAKDDDSEDSRKSFKTSDDYIDSRWSFKAKGDDGEDSRKSFKASDDDKDGRCSFKSSKCDDGKDSRRGFIATDDDKDGRWSFKTKIDDGKDSKKSFKGEDGKKSPKSKPDRPNTKMKTDRHKTDRDKDKSE